MNENESLKFKKLFGIEPQSLGDALIISPFLGAKLFKAELKQQKFFKGIVYNGITGIYKNRKISFINTGMGYPLVVDCLLALDEKRVSSVIFLGAAGAVNSLQIADCVVVTRAFFDQSYYERFNIHVLEKSETQGFGPDDKLLALCENKIKTQCNDLKKITLLSLNSLWCQDEKMVLSLKEKGIQAVDLEAAMFYAAAKNKKLKALALCFVSDLLLTKPYWSEFSLAEKLMLKKSIGRLVKLALEISVLR